ncbi:MAG: c-type cytochrome [Terracidiphilus sp.]
MMRRHAPALAASNCALIAACIAVCMVLSMAGCAHAPGYPPAAIASPGAVTDFAALYNQNCAGCHGRDGQNGPAIDLRNPEYQALVDDATLRKWISGGMPGTLMPAFAQSAGGMLTDAQIGALIAGMRKQWQAANAFAGDVPPAYVQTEAGDARRGAQAYQAHCAGCHDGSRQQIASPVYLALVGDQTLRSMIVAGRPDIGQPDWRHDGPGGKSAAPLSGPDVDDIVAYLRSLRNAEPGTVSAAGGR